MVRGQNVVEDLFWGIGSRVPIGQILCIIIIISHIQLILVKIIPIVQFIVNLNDGRDDVHTGHTKVSNSRWAQLSSRTRRQRDMC